eukprot:2271332-Prymnesium_polylepis.1
MLLQHRRLRVGAEVLALQLGCGQREKGAHSDGQASGGAARRAAVSRRLAQPGGGTVQLGAARCGAVRRRIGIPARPAPRRRRADTRTSVAPYARA